MTTSRKFLFLLLAFMLAIPTVFAQAQNDSLDNLQPSRDQSIQNNLDLYQAITRNINLFGALYREVSMNYVDQVNPEAFIRAGIDGMLSTLDPYTEFYEEEETDELEIMTRGKYGGIGIQIGLRGPERELTIIAPIEGTPGYRIGLRPGDRIVEIDGQSTEGFSTSDAAQIMRGTPGDTVRISILRYGLDDPLEYAIQREVINVHDISYSGMVEPGVGFIRLTRFSRTAGDQVREEIEKLKEQGLEALILDLRGNPGGLLPEAVSIAENFLNNGDLIVSTQGRIRTSHREFFSRAEPSIPMDMPLVVLVNQGSASASEIVSGAIQDHDRGVIIGMPTFGKGLVQSVINFNPKKVRGSKDAALKITTAKYYTPSGRLIQKADYFKDNEALIPLSAEAGEIDTLFFTTHGRPVPAHGGIHPDFEIELEDIGQATLELWRQGEFFGFIGPYYAEHQEITSYEITDDIFNEFNDYLNNKEFTFETQTQKSLNEIREHAEDMEYSEEFFKELEDLEKLAEIERDNLISMENVQIRERLRMELAGAMKGGSGRVEASFKFDPQVQKALEILKEKNEYFAALNPEEMDLKQE
ncbi:S41 family peptidase [bacterium]|nr:S41 family peptidase [bacterium]